MQVLHKLKNVVHVHNNEPIGITICPDKFVRNDKVSGLVTTLYDTYTAPIHRIKWNKGIMYAKKHIPIWEITLSPTGINFNLYTNEDFYNLVYTKLNSTWPDAAIQRMGSIEEAMRLNLAHSYAAYMKTAEHHMLSLDQNNRQNYFLFSLLNASKLMQDGEQAIVQIVLNPVSDEWQDECSKLYEDYRNTGELPTRLFDNPMRSFKRGVESVLDFTLETIEDWITFLVPETEQKNLDGVHPRKRKALRQLLHSANKMLYHGFDTQIRIGCQAPSSARARIILKAIGNAFKELDGDNKMVLVPVRNSAPIIERINSRTPDPFGECRSILCTKEIEQIIAMPTNDIQKVVPAIHALQFRETDVDPALTKKGIIIGSVHRKGTSQKVYYLVDNHDILCLPRIVIGQMGSGKSSYASTFARSAFVDNNFNVIAIDVADGRMCNQIRDSIPPDRKNDIIELDFGKLTRPIGLVWNEAIAGMQKPGNRVTSELLAFLEKITGTFGPQMRRWAKKAAQAVFEDPDSTILDVILMLVDDNYRIKRIPKIKNIAVKQAWMQFQSFDVRKQQQIVSPVLNRLDYLLDDDNMKNILCQIPKKTPDGQFALDFRKLINQDARKPYKSKCILIKVPVSELGEAATDVVVAFLISKIWLTVQTRDKNTVLESGVPTFLLMDEPHQFMSSAENWKRMVVESRKWRLGLVWFFHTWTQIEEKSKELAKTIKSAGIHYILYNSSKDTWRSLAEEISPFTIEEALALPKYHALVTTQTPNGPTAPMLVKMEPPVDHVYPVYDNSDISVRCLQQYGRDVNEVEKEIAQKELSLLGLDIPEMEDMPVQEGGMFSRRKIFDRRKEIEE